MFVNLYIYSKNFTSLNAFLVFILKIFENKLTKTFFLTFQHSKPTAVKKITILKSPHVNKKAQEQFEYRIYKTQISLHTSQMLKLLKILKRIQFKLFADVNVKLRIGVNDRKFNLKSRKRLNPNKPFLKTNHKRKLKTISYLKLLDMYGENSFFDRQKF